MLESFPNLSGLLRIGDRCRADASWHEFEQVSAVDDDSYVESMDLQTILGKLSETPINMEAVP